jgi:hypothetical protein
MLAFAMIACRVMSRFHSAIAALAFACSAAWAQTPPPAPATDSMIGAWEISNAARDRSCILTFKSDPAPGGMKVEPDQACEGAFPTIRGLTAWSLGPNMALKLLDGGGQPLLEMTEVESGMFEGERRGEGLFFLQSQAALNAGIKIEQLFGDWNVVRGITAICTITLVAEAVKDDDFKIEVKPGCDAVIARFAPAIWKFQRGELLIGGKGGMWRFEEVDAVTWRRIPPGTEPLQIVKRQ